MIQLDIFSDPVCPWCYIGKGYLDQALQANPNHPFQVRWLPFMLNPEMPETGRDRREHLEAKFGSKEAAAEAHRPILEHAEKAGVTLNFDKIERTPSSLHAQRLIHWGGVEGVQTAVVSALFKAYFVEGRDISDFDVLCDIADSSGLDAGLIARLLKSDADREEIVEQDAAARGMGVSAVPTFIVASQHAVPGAQPPELWQKVIDELAAGADPAA